MRSAEQVLLDDLPEGSTDAEKTLLVCSIYSDEKPLRRAAGILDWRLKGFLSRFLVKGWISGERNEFVYIPIKHHDGIRHLLLVGLGKRSGASSRSTQEGTLFLNRFGETVRKLGFKKIALSESSFDFIEKEDLKRACSSAVEIEYAQ